MKQITKTFISPIILILFIIIFIILRIPSLSEPHWYGDEGVYAGVAYAMEHGKILYSQVWDNKPPGIYFIYMLGNPGNRLFIIRFLNIVAGVLSLAGLAALIKKLQFHTIAAYITLALTVFLLGTPILEGNIANAENFFLPTVIWGLYFGLSQNYKNLFIAGIIFGLGFWIKFHPLFDMSALALFIMFTQYQKDYKKMLLSLCALGCGFLIPIGLLLLYLIYHNTLVIGLKTIFLGNVQYTKMYQLPYLTQEVRLFFLAGAYGLAFYLYHIKKISKTALFILCIFLIEYFSALLSGRRYTHYLIAVITGLSLLIGFTVGKCWEYKHLVRSRIFAILIFIILVGGFHIFALGEGYLLDTNPIKYYWKYYEFQIGSKDYFLKPIELRIAGLNDKLTTKYAGLSVYLNVDNPWYYDQTATVPLLTFVPAYHQDLRENGRNLYIEELTKANPSLIVFEKGSYANELFKEYLAKKYIKDDEDETFEYYVLKNGLK